jgi:predicted metal-dependent phosphoesterase TrpH
MGTPPDISRVDLHCRSSACAPPEQVYALAKQRGMDFVTITDQDSIAAASAIADRPDVFVSVELTARFRDAPQTVHVLCWDVSKYHHEWLQRHRDDIEMCAAYLREHAVACALAHPFLPVCEAPLTPRQRRRLAELFCTWEVRNGALPRALNVPASIYLGAHHGNGVGGSDDTAGVHVGRTYTETPAAATPRQFLAHVRAGRSDAHGEEGNGTRWSQSGPLASLSA